MVTPLAGRPPDDLGAWPRDVGYLPGAQDHRWLARWSVPLAEIDAALLERALTATTMKRDGANIVG